MRSKLSGNLLIFDLFPS